MSKPTLDAQIEFIKNEIVNPKIARKWYWHTMQFMRPRKDYEKLYAVLATLREASESRRAPRLKS